MIRDVVLHLMSEQPLLADLDALPGPSDNLIICTNPTRSPSRRSACSSSA